MQFSPDYTCWGHAGVKICQQYDGAGILYMCVLFVCIHLNECLTYAISDKDKWLMQSWNIEYSAAAQNKNHYRDITALHYWPQLKHSTIISYSLHDTSKMKNWISQHIRKVKKKKKDAEAAGYSSLAIKALWGLNLGWIGFLHYK